MLPSKRVAILQSCYIPWKGYFDLINSVDEFVFYEDVQYTRQDWRNRNLIKTVSGKQWLTIPIQARFGQTIAQTRVSDSRWIRKHWHALCTNYGRSPFFDYYVDGLSKMYERAAELEFLSQINRLFIGEICDFLGVKTRLSLSSKYSLNGDKTERLVGICRQLQAQSYLTGPAAKAYIQDELFSAQNIQLLFMDYSGYPEYPQLYPPFEHGVTILDLLFSTGPNARQYMKSFPVVVGEGR